MAGVIDRTEGASQYIFKQKANNLGFRQIANGLKENFGINVSHMTVKNHVDSKAGDIQYVLAGNDELKRETEGIIKETVEELKKLKARMWKLLDKLEYDADSRTMVQAAAEIRKLLETQERILNTFAGPSKTSVNIGDLNLKIENIIQNNFIGILQKLEDRGLIKIKGDREELKSYI